MDRKKGSGHVCKCVFMHICLYVSEDFSGLRALTEPNVVPYGSGLDNTLLRHVFSAVVFPARAWGVIRESGHGLDTFLFRRHLLGNNLGSGNYKYCR